MIAPSAVRRTRRTAMPKMPSHSSGGQRGDHDFSAPAITRAAVDPLRRWRLESVRGLPGGTAVLAVGCEQAFLAPQLAECAADVTVLDTSGAQLGQLARRFPEISFFQHDPASPLPFARDTFGAIWCCDLLDRVFDPTTIAAELHRVIAPGGRLLVTVPDHGGLRHGLSPLFNPGETSVSNPRIRQFTQRSLGKLLREAGFTAMRSATSAAVQRAADGFFPRTLLLRGKKGRGVQLMPAASRPSVTAGGAGLAGDSDSPGRVRAA